MTDNQITVHEQPAMVAMIERMARDPSVDVEKMERLVALQERALARQAKQEYAEAMTRAQAAMPAVVTNKRNTQTNSNYASFDRVDQVAKPIYTGHGFSLSFDTDASPLEHHVRIVCHVMHVSGHSEVRQYDAPLDDSGIAGKVNKTPTHARASSISYGRRYLTVLIFNIRIIGEDDDGNSAHAADDRSGDWIAAIDNASTLAELDAVKAELKKAYIAKAVPAALTQAWNARKKELAA